MLTKMSTNKHILTKAKNLEIEKNLKINILRHETGIHYLIGHS